jgi:RHS repeat-associated protein
VYQNNTAIEPKHEYVYDALYRLVQATGRENAAAMAPPPSDEGPWPTGGFPSANGVRNYTQTYRYDAVGNFRTMQHAPDSGTGWTRHYAYAFNDPGQPASNRLWRTWTNRPAWDGSRADSVTYHYDSHGSMLNLNRVEVPPPQAEDWGHQISWDWRDMISRFDAIGGGWARYHYSIDKQRTRKHITREGGVVEDRIYLGGYELYRRRNSTAGAVVEEIESLHLFEGEQRVLLVDDVITARSGGPGEPTVRAQTLFRYQYGNHLGSVGMELDDTARVISYEEFHPYGTSAFRLMNSAIEAPPKQYQYTGMERDEESGLSYHSARYNLLWLGRWGSCDPIGTKDGINLYRYARDSPVNVLDVTGTEVARSHQFDDQVIEGSVPTPGGVPKAQEPNAPAVKPLEADPVAGFTGGEPGNSDYDKYVAEREAEREAREQEIIRRIRLEQQQWDLDFSAAYEEERRVFRLPLGTTDDPAERAALGRVGPRPETPGESRFSTGIFVAILILQLRFGLRSPRGGRPVASPGKVTEVAPTAAESAALPKPGASEPVAMKLPSAPDWVPTKAEAALRAKAESLQRILADRLHELGTVVGQEGKRLPASAATDPIAIAIRDELALVQKEIAKLRGTSTPAKKGVTRNPTPPGTRPPGLDWPRGGWIIDD